MRLIAIGDIHGHFDKLTRLLDQVTPTPEDRLVFLGDYIDRGPASKGVVDYLMELSREFPLTVFLRGNHEQMMLDCIAGYAPERLPGWEVLFRWPCGLLRGGGPCVPLNGHLHNLFYTLLLFASLQICP